MASQLTYSMLMSALLLGLVFRIVHFFEKGLSFWHIVFDIRVVRTTVGCFESFRNKLF